MNRLLEFVTENGKLSLGRAIPAFLTLMYGWDWGNAIITSGDRPSYELLGGVLGTFLLKVAQKKFEK
jgi:hypothetical protein